MAHIIDDGQDSVEHQQPGHLGQPAGQKIGHDPQPEQGREVAAVPVACGPAWLGTELRRLRKAQGMTQRVLAQQLGYSAHSAIADYEAGRRIPANDVLIGYERLFRLPAGSLQRRRAAVLAWLAEEQACAQVDVPAVQHVRAAEPSPSPTHDTAPQGGRPRWRRWVLQRRVIIPGVTALVLVAVASSWAMAGDSRPGLALDPTWGQSSQHVTDKAERNVAPEDMDGDDPRARDCVFDAVVRDTVPLLLPGASRSVCCGCVILSAAGPAGGLPCTTIRSYTRYRSPRPGLPTARRPGHSGATTPRRAATVTCCRPRWAAYR